MTTDSPLTPAPQVPVVVAVTGHRDLRPEDLAEESPLRRGVGDCFEQLRASHPHTPILLLSGMAEGADQLVIEVALEGGIEVMACLPKPMPEYLRELPTGTQALLRSLAAGRGRVLVVPEANEAATPESAQDYVALGRFLVRHAQVLLALWDGNDTEKKGGTKHVIDMMLGEAPQRELLDLSDEAAAGHVLHLPVVRRGSPPSAMPATTGVCSVVAPSSTTGTIYRHLLPHVEALNVALKRVHAEDSGGVAASRQDFVGDVPEQVWAPARGLLDGQTHVDRLAIEARGHASRALRTITALASATGLFFLLYTDLHQRPCFLLLYLAALITTTWYLFRRVRRLDSKNRHLDFRALAEGLRIGVFWRLAGVESGIADHYLQTPAGELSWIRTVLRTWCLVATSADAGLAGGRENSERSGAHLDAVRTRWIDNQATWYGSTSKQRARSRDRMDLAERILLGLAFLCSIVLTVAALLALPASMLGSLDFSPLLTESTPGAFNWLQLGAGALLLAVALCVAWSEARAYSEEAQEFDRMAVLFQRAAAAAKRMQGKAYPGDGERDFVRLVEALGRETLRENAEWLLLHRKRPLTARVG